MKALIYIVLAIFASSFLAHAQFEGEYYDGASMIRLTIVDADTSVIAHKAGFRGDGSNYIGFILNGADTSITQRSSRCADGSSYVIFLLAGSDTSINYMQSSRRSDGSAYVVFLLAGSDTSINYMQSSRSGDGHSSIVFDTLFKYALETPVNLRASLIEQHKIVLEWDDVAGVDNYKLFRSLVPEGPYLLVYTGLNNEYSDAGEHLKSFTNYYYRIIAENTSGNSALSDILQVKTLPELHSIALTTGWNMISTYVEAENAAMEEVFSEIKSSTVIVKNNVGQIYYPEFEINDIGDWNVLHGYQVYMSQNETLSIVGMKIMPELQPITLNSGWNIISYLRDNPMNIEIALASLVSENNLIIAKDNFGNVFYPAFEINMIGDMLPGQGYQIYILESTQLLYPKN
ncbi:MAG: fibronectin type III domain-containing protein [Candidatus Kapabacteria bacterium]|nr:fibronectin type III domain-containing protein [Candidatus Kapabacteria bacterium]